ncbi:ABC transporter substrate-binding protein [Bosea sp. (in: a-proteobacteria)]|uniref:ABC transporter substrate-binding protein n=1 Tax=Bosea sp. (in: a-proteobacteria) TaxID=1871050 RepID=UPI002613D111|nr:ABC transporter substrate-binding protein [Bosea sp. (in: a-proteobacteria)]MCO5091012.1 ABC transporter substrate-binding protein [Bosea sp. (in: a-proteobacteria)]
MRHHDRRTILAGGASLAAAGALGIGRASAQPKEIKIALIVAQTGPWASLGGMERAGAEMAVEDINARGGVKALGGAKLRLIITDAGDSAERAKNAAQRLVAQESDLVAGLGAGLSFLSLAVTEVWERERIPWLTLSYADSVTNRGFKYLIASSATSSRIARETMPSYVGLVERAIKRRPATIGMVADSQPATQAYIEELRKGGLAAVGLKIAVDETFTPVLSDATGIIQRVRRARPDFLLLYTSNVPDTKLIIEKMDEFGIGRGKIPVLAPGSQVGAPEMLDNIAKESLEGIVCTASNWGSRKQNDIVESLKKRSRQPWTTQEILSSYGHVMLIHDALERAKSADRDALMAALRSTDTSDPQGPAKFFLGERLRFDETGRRMDAPVAVMQWQDGVPVTVGPPGDALAELRWSS